MVATATSLVAADQELQRMQQLFNQQQLAYRQHPLPTAAERISDLKRLKQALLKYRTELATAVNEDFSCRSIDETEIAEIMTCAQGIDYSVKHLKRWMKPSRRHVSMLFAPSHNHVMYQPLGVVGIMVPWNYPIQLAILPLATALSAGNRAMIKMSEFTPATNKVLQKMLSDVFNESQVALIEGEVEVSSAFAELPWDHLIFTGSTAVGKIVMSAAAKNLTPVTLELGGKSPAIIAPGASMEDAVERICFGKSLNAGQTCIAPDYILLPEGQEQTFIDTYQKTFARMYPSLRDNSDYTAIVNQRQFGRLQSWVEDARQKGAKITVVNPAAEDFSGTRKMPLHIIENGNADMKVLQEELFGPVLPVVPYKTLDSAIDYINDRDRPLALYLFSYDKAIQNTVLQRTHAGGVSINDTLMHIAQDDMPFGGVGPSGMGHYHGKEGFIALSKAKAVHRKGKFNSGQFIYPPYGNGIQKLIKKFFIR
ncbi:MAG: coniferyl-aldehyde dehydrogenase [Oceanospirillaceae bacterium]|uniref:coniferyl aldehyde dehydrogenase n=1 Tax=unclassified Thalassolituus TaxID=2624967 RepID=UPI000C0A8C2C|nr:MULTISPECIES: coniferyl aldehyde dehydrogenase [unclassified Thalassolituus]MAK90579.1 coniferyl-aldehyde dehydrogenase [Thalassolituus sp.]MBL36544.1 coniferyl-aldehyde dehydrogenase [Oceanospirillaceae bacterium]MBS53388.1 coniferyl-aldehyde dehydrogenase [Oceanospirillaceae bacterium]|tara:strand:- start:254 stop:1696 length:1443 start_codon:yes stop_codon:yes gene_type:complete